MTDVGPVRPPGLSALEHRGSRVNREAEVGGIRDIEANLAALTMGIPDMSFEEVPYHLQRHAVGVPESIGRFLRKVAQVVVCYRDISDLGLSTSFVII